jgi:anti-anti-sigma factor
MSTVRRPAQFAVQDVACGRGHTLFLRGELDMGGADCLEAVVFCLLVDEIDGISLNLSKLAFIDATGLRSVRAVRELCLHRGLAFSLTRPTGQVRRLFEMTGAADDLSVGSVGRARSPGHRQIRPVSALSSLTG